MRRLLRVSGTLAIASGLCLLFWSLVVWRWQDPFTALYTAYQQHRLAADYDSQLAAYRPLLALEPPPGSGTHPARHPRLSLSAERRLIAREAKRYGHSLHMGEPIGRLEIPRIGVHQILVNGTDHDSLTKGPGRYIDSFLPGQGELIYIAGHRTTYGAPFAHIDRLRPGDVVTIKVPYGTFVYRITRSVIVPADDLGQLRTPGYEVVKLQACHPRFFATQRYIAYARPLRVIPAVGRPYAMPVARRAVRAAAS